MAVDTPAQASVVIQPGNLTEPLDLAAIFDVSRPLDLDLGCGKGRFLLARARQFKERNILGVDRMQGRLNKLTNRIIREQLNNARLLRMEGAYTVTHLLPPASVSSAYILFPDPWPKRRHHRRRLINAPFCMALERLLIPGGCVHVATDHLDYFASMQQTFRAHPGFAELIPGFEPSEDERTDFERLFMAQGLTIGRGSFQRLG